MSHQPLLLYPLIVERSVSHPVRPTAGVPLVTPRYPLSADAIVALGAGGRVGGGGGRERGPAGCETILGRKRRESSARPTQPSVSAQLSILLRGLTSSSSSSQLRKTCESDDPRPTTPRLVALDLLIKVG